VTMCVDLMKTLTGIDPDAVLEPDDANLLALQIDHTKERLNLPRDMKKNVERLMLLDGYVITQRYVTPPDESKEEQKENKALAKEHANEKKKAKEDRAKAVWDADRCNNDKAVEISNRDKGRDANVTPGELDSLEQSRVRNALGDDYWDGVATGDLAMPTKAQMVTLTDPKFHTRFAYAGLMTQGDYIAEPVARYADSRNRVGSRVWDQIGLSTTGGVPSLRDAALVNMFTILGFTSHLDFGNEIELTGEKRTQLVQCVENYRCNTTIKRTDAPALDPGTIDSNVRSIISSVLPVKFKKVRVRDPNDANYRLVPEVTRAPIPSYENYLQHMRFKSALAGGNAPL
jgi:hypothetical protein